MKTKKELEERIIELVLLLKQKDNIIEMLNVQYQNNIPNPFFDGGCEHEWEYSDNSTAGQSRTCKKCGIWELVQPTYGIFPYTTGTPNPAPPFIVGDDPNKDIKVGDI